MKGFNTGSVDIKSMNGQGFQTLHLLSPSVVYRFIVNSFSLKNHVNMKGKG